MKNLFPIIIVLFIIPSCFAQSKLKAGRFNIEGVTFIVNEYPNKNYNSYSIYAEGKYTKGYPQPKTQDPIPVLKDDVHFDLNKLEKIIYDKIAYKRTKLKEAKGSLNLTIAFEQNGSIAQVSYRFKDNTTNLSLQEIADIDKQIKESIKATFTGPDYVNFYVIPYPGIVIRF